MNDYNMCQVTYREKCKERIQRQLAISKTFYFHKTFSNLPGFNFDRTASSKATYVCDWLLSLHLENFQKFVAQLGYPTPL